MAHVIQLPIFDEMAESLKKKGSYSKELSEQEVVQIMESIVQNLLTGQQKVKAAVPTPKVHIENDVATVSSETHVESPVKATIAINCKLGNDVSPQRLKLIQSDIQEKAGPLDKLKLKAVNVEHRVQKTLSDPNQALRTALENQLQPRGARLTDTALHLHKQTLAINLKGGPVGTSK
jgi:hypothetical protein